MTKPEPTAPQSAGMLDPERRYLKRTVIAGLVTLALVALNAGVYWSLGWAVRYLAAGVWAMVFFALTPLILKAFLQDRRRGIGSVYIALKIFWIGLMFAACHFWLIGPGESVAKDGSALIAGVTTPLLVVVLRELGALLNRKTPTAQSGRSGRCARVESR